MKAHSKGFLKLVTYHSCRFPRRRKILSNVQSHYRKVTQGAARNPEIFVNSYLQLSWSLFQQLLLLEIVVIAPVWVMIPLRGFSGATVLQLLEQFNESLPK